MSTTKKIIYLDASTLKSSACLKYVYLHNIKGLKPAEETGKNFKMNYGTACHAALGSPFNNKPAEHGYYSGENQAACIRKALNHYAPYEEEAMLSKWNSWQHSEHLRQTLTLYFALNKFGEDGIKPLLDSAGNPILEQKFAIPIWSNDSYEIALSGIIDMQCEYFGTHCILDHKTHAITMFDGANPVKKFFNMFRMDVQTQFYCWIDKMANRRNHYLPILINGIFLKKPTEKALKQGVFDGCILERSPLIEYSDVQMLEFTGWLDKKLEKLKELLNALDVEKAFFKEFERSVCHNYGGCKFFKACELGDINSQRIVLESEFFTQEYNPLTWRD